MPQMFHYKLKGSIYNHRYQKLLQTTSSGTHDKPQTVWPAGPTSNDHQRNTHQLTIHVHIHYSGSSSSTDIGWCAVIAAII